MTRCRFGALGYGVVTLRLQAVRAIKMIGPCDSTALSVLNEMIHDGHAVVAESAMRVLRDVEKE